MDRNQQNQQRERPGQAGPQEMYHWWCNNCHTGFATDPVGLRQPVCPSCASAQVEVAPGPWIDAQSGRLVDPSLVTAESRGSTVDIRIEVSLGDGVVMTFSAARVYDDRIGAVIQDGLDRIARRTTHDARMHATIQIRRPD